MKRATLWIVVISAVLQILVALFPLVPGLKDMFPASPTPRDLLDWQIFFIGAFMVILTASVLIVLWLERTNTDQLVDAVKSVASGTRTALLRDDDFYIDFLLNARKAKGFVAISYFAPYPPEKIPDADRHRYYEAMGKLIDQRKDVQFRRLVAKTKANVPWLAELLKSQSGHANASIAMIEDRAKDDMPLALSVQIIDNARVWLVAIESHERTGEYRDLFLESEIIGAMMLKYYDRLWNRATVLLNAGRLTDEGEGLLNRAKEGQEKS